MSGADGTLWMVVRESFAVARAPLFVLDEERERIDEVAYVAVLVRDVVTLDAIGCGPAVWPSWEPVVVEQSSDGGHGKSIHPFPPIFASELLLRFGPQASNALPLFVCGVKPNVPPSGELLGGSGEGGVSLGVERPSDGGVAGCARSLEARGLRNVVLCLGREVRGRSNGGGAVVLDSRNARFDHALGSGIRPDHSL